MAHRVTSDYVIQSPASAGETWAADLPSDRFGNGAGRTVVQGGNTVAAFSEGMLWSDPRGDGGGGGGGSGGEVKPTNTPPW